METREQEQLGVDTGETLRNPLLAFIGRRYFAPPVDSQIPSREWMAEPEGHGLWLTRLAETVHLDVPLLRSALYDVTSLLPWNRSRAFEAIVCGAIFPSCTLADSLRLQYEEYCATAVWTRLQADRRVLVVRGATLYDAHALAATLGWFSWQGWDNRMRGGPIAATRWNRRQYTTQEALRCWLCGRPRPPMPDLSAAVRAAGCSRRLPPGLPVRVKGSLGTTWVEFPGVRCIWGMEVAKLYAIPAKTLRAARREGRLESAMVNGKVLIPFDSLQSFLKWWYVHDYPHRRRGHADVREGQ